MIAGLQTRKGRIISGNESDGDQELINEEFSAVAEEWEEEKNEK